MRRTLTRTALMTSLLALTLSGPLASTSWAKPTAVRQAMQGIRWGQPMSDVVGVLLQRIESDLEAQLAKTPGWEPKSKLRKTAQERMRKLRSSYTQFKGDPTPHDRALRGHVGHHNDESVLVDNHGSVTDYYLFHKDRLWKWVRVLESPSLRSRGFAAFGNEVQKRFGRGRAKSGSSEISNHQRWLEWQQAGTRLRALDQDGNGAYTLVFDDPRRSKQVLKARSSARAPKQEVASAGHARQKNLRSVMSQTQQTQETPAEARARARREQQRRAQARRTTHERNQQKKQGRVLSGLDGLDDSDPLGGLGQ